MRCWDWARAYKELHLKLRKLAPFSEKHPIVPWDIIIHFCNTGLAGFLTGGCHETVYVKDSFIKHH